MQESHKLWINNCLIVATYGVLTIFNKDSKFQSDHIWFAGVRECPPWCSIVGATVTVHQFFCMLHYQFYWRCRFLYVNLVSYLNKIWLCRFFFLSFFLPSIFWYMLLTTITLVYYNLEEWTENNENDKHGCHLDANKEVFSSSNGKIKILYYCHEDFYLAFFSVKWHS